MNGTRRLLRGERGQTLVEAALSITLLLAMVFGIIVGGFMLYTYHFLSYAARQGARYAMVRGSACDNSHGMPDCPNVNSEQIQTYVRGLRELGISPTLLTVTAAWPNEGQPNDPLGNKPGDPVQVTAEYPFPLWVPFVISQTVEMHSTSEMVISQ